MSGYARATASFALLAAGVACHSAEPADTINRLMAICLAHPEFQPDSVDFYEPEKSVDWEREFYDGARSLHGAGAEPIDLLLKTRTKATPAQVRCVDGILNTWPG